MTFVRTSLIGQTNFLYRSDGQYRVASLYVMIDDIEGLHCETLCELSWHSRSDLCLSTVCNA